MILILIDKTFKSVTKITLSTCTKSENAEEDRNNAIVQFTKAEIRRLQEEWKAQSTGAGNRLKNKAIQTGLTALCIQIDTNIVLMSTIIKSINHIGAVNTFLQKQLNMKEN